VVGDLTLEACDPVGFMPCEQQALVIVEPVAASGVSLVYSSQWADGRTDRPAWSAASLGLGGWSLDVLHRYDPGNGILLMGDGSWRAAEAVDIGSGQRAVPSFDGFRYFVFDAEWRHVRTVDTATGSELLAFTYDDQGRLTDARGQGPDGPVELTTERAADGALRAVLGLGGTRTGLVLGSSSEIVAISRTNGSAAHLGYVDFGMVTSWQESGRGAFAFEYDATGRLTSFAD
jgi:YD repeat-containing protein